MSTSTIPREEMGNATGLFNMLRNIGGSIGIAMATTAIIRRAALHQTEIGANLSPSNPVLQQKSQHDRRISRPPARSWLLRVPGSMGLMYGLLLQQSALLAYVDVFRWTALLAFFCAACRLALSANRQSSAAPPPGAH